MNNKTYLKIIVGSVIGIIILSISFFIVLNRDTSDNSTSLLKENSLINENSTDVKKDILLSATELLQIASASPNDDTFDARLQKLDSGDLSVINEELNDKIILTEEFSGSSSNTIDLYQTLIALSQAIITNNENSEITPYNDVAYSTIYLDKENGQAFVPLSAFTGTQSYFSLEFLYVDGEWKLAPYSLVEEVRLSSSLTS